MKSTIENAMSILASRINASTTSDDALKFTQAALNLAHALTVHILNQKNQL